MKRTKRWLCLLLVLCMMVSMLPVIAAAETSADVIIEAEDALTEAQDVYDNDKATQAEVDAAEEALKGAQNALDRVTPAPVDKAELEKAISKAESLVDDETYTAASRKDLKAALDVAKEVFDNADATQEEVDAAAAKLNKAIADLQKSRPSIPAM